MNHGLACSHLVGLRVLVVCILQVQPKGALVGTVSSVGIRIASQVAAAPSSITKSTPVGQLAGEEQSSACTPLPLKLLCLLLCSCQG